MNPTRHRMLLAAAILLAGTVVAAQPPSVGAASTTVAPLLARLEGTWRGSGTILGQPARVEMRCAPVLGDAFQQLTWVSRIGPEPTPRRFEGQAFYGRTAGGVGHAVWVDSTGLTRPILATISADGAALVAAWGTADTEVGETTYRFESATRLLVVDRVRLKDGSWREFGRSSLSRTLPPE